MCRGIFLFLKALNKEAQGDMNLFSRRELSPCLYKGNHIASVMQRASAKQTSCTVCTLHTTQKLTALV